MAQAAKMDFDRGGTMAEEEVEEGGGGSKKLIIIIIIVLVLLLGGAGAAYFLWYLPSTEESAEAKGPSASEELVGAEEEDVRTSGVEKVTNPAYFELPDPQQDDPTYTTNLMDGRRFIVVRLAAEYEMEEDMVAEYLEARRPLLDDIILSYLSTLDSAAAQHRTARETMKKQIKRKINALFNADFMEKYPGKGNPVKQIVIQKFILQ